MSSRATVSTEFLRILQRASEDAGVASQAVLSASGIDTDVVGQRGLRIPVDRSRRAWREAALMSGDPLFGLHAAERLPHGALDVLDYLTRSSPTIGSALDRLIRYLPVFVDTGDLSLTRSGNVAVFTHAGRGAPACVTELLLSLIVRRGREFSGSDWAPREVRLTHAPAARVSQYESAFAAPVKFGRALDELVFEREMLETPLKTADPVLLRILELGTEHVLSVLRAEARGVSRAEPSSIAGRFESEFEVALREGVVSGDPGIERVAGRLGLSKRSAQRRLRELGTSHSELLRKVRLELAQELLRHSEGSQAELASALSYASASSFHRAYKRWSGHTPGRERRQ